jgi:hypothetical protein
MKRIIVLLAIVLITMLMTLSLQSCFVPYNGRDDRGGDHRGDRDDRGDPRGDHRGDQRGDRDGKGDRR